MPNFLNLSQLFSKPGSCCDEHVGVNAPGKLNRTTLLPLKKSSVVFSIHLPPIAHSFELLDLSPSLNLKKTLFNL